MRKILRSAMLCGFFVMCLTAVVFAQTSNITGTVSDNEGLTIPGVSVSVKDTKTSVLTDVNGKYNIKAPLNGILVFSYIGMQRKEVHVDGRALLNVTLIPTTTALNEVVVVGYGTAKKVNLTTAQTSLNAADLNKTVNTTIEQAIQGRSAGVYITQNSGQPGGGISVNIRGVNSINGANEPLYVVDGVQIQPGNISLGSQSSSNPLAGLNPADIEDIQVLQGPSATSIYGSRATNGVLLITTKRGKAGDTKIVYGYQHSIQTTPNNLDVMNLRQYAQMVNEYHAVAGGKSPQEYLDPSLLGEGTDWQRELFNNAPMDKHQLSLSGGNEKTTYYLSGDYLNQKGVAVGSGFNRYSFRLNLDNKPREWITLGANLSFNQTKENLTNSQENIISNALQLTPQVPVKNEDGSWGAGETDANHGENQYSPVNPIALANLTINDNVRRQFLGGLNLGVKILDGLNFRSSFNTDIGYSNSEYYIPTYKIGWKENVTASLENSVGINTYWNWNQQLQYTKKFGKHNFDVMATHEAQASTWKNLSAGRTGFLTNDILDIAAGDELTASNAGGSSNWGMESYLGRLNYNYDDRYIVSATIRADGSSNFGADNKWGTFPSVSAAWRVSQEKFFNVPAISELKLRFETGTTGNQGGSGLYSPMIAGATPTGTGFLPGRYGNSGLQWEETKTDNIGINIGLLKDRIQIDADYYVKNTNNLLLTNPLPWYMGSNGQGAVSAPIVNIGALQNKGWGITFNTVNINSKNFKWSSNLNLSHFKTKIKKFNSDNAFIEKTSWWLDSWTQRATLGDSPWLFRGYIEEGLFQSVDEINNSAVPVDNNGNRLPTDATTGVWVGDVKFKDISGPNGVPDGKIDVNDQTNIGNPWPKLYGGFSNTFSYKGFDLSVLLTGTFGNDVYNYMARTNSNPNNINLSRNLLTHAMDYAKVITAEDGTVSLANPGTDVARISNGPNGNYSKITNKWVEDGSFVRLKNVTLSYSLPASLLAKQKLVRGVRLSVSGQNLAIITKYTGYDPEVGAYVGRDADATNQAIGLDFGRYPLTAIYSFSIGVDF